MTDGKNQTTTFIYNAFDQVTQVQFAGGSTDYDPADNLVSFIELARTYDSSQRLPSLTNAPLTATYFSTRRTSAPT